MITEKTWTDQPDVLAGLPVLLSFATNGRVIEVRQDEQKYFYVTVGNLIMSQTVRCDRTETMFAAIGHACRMRTGAVMSIECEKNPEGRHSGHRIVVDGGLMLGSIDLHCTLCGLTGRIRECDLDQVIEWDKAGGS
jgi:hypothetical protein